MTRPRTGKPRPPLDPNSLQELALRYVGRFATSRAKLVTYLSRKLGERGWRDDQKPDVEALVERLSDLGYVDDAGFALAKARGMAMRGYGERRVNQALHAAGIAEDDREAANELSESEAVNAALKFARRKRIGPYAAVEPDPKSREKHLAAMVRAGHGFALSRAIVDSEAGTDPDLQVFAALK